MRTFAIRRPADPVVERYMKWSLEWPSQVDTDLKYTDTEYHASEISFTVEAAESFEDFHRPYRWFVQSLGSGEWARVMEQNRQMDIPMTQHDEPLPCFD